MTADRIESVGITGLLRNLARYVRPYRLHLIPVILACILEMTFSAQVPLSMKFLIDRALGQHDQRVLILVLVALGSGAAIVSVAGLGRDYLYSRVVTRTMADMRYKMFAQLQNLSIDFYARTEVGDVLSRFSSDLNTVNEVLNYAVGWGIQPALDLFLTTVLVFAFEWRLALVGVLICPVCVLGPRILSRRAMRASSEKQSQESVLLSSLQENVSAPALIRAFNLQKMFLGSFFRRNRDLMNAGVKLGFLSSAMDRSSSFGTLVLQVIVMGIGGYMAFEGKMSIGTFASFQALFVSLSYAFGYIVQWSPSLIGATGGMTRIQQLLEEQPKVADRSDAVALSPLQNGIAFEDVTFSYDGTQKNLDRVSLFIPAGKFAAFVGPSGSGKSTTLNLIMRFYDPAQGRVTFDGTDLRNATQDSLRSQSAMVFQENFMFNMSIRENIALGKPDASFEEIVEAAKAAEIHDFIVSLPEGYNTVAGERGSRFSGGQRQRLAIARAVLRNPAILVLDEATSALDSATEAAINATFEKVARGRTMVSVTHRLSSAVNADMIFVMDKGRLAEQGSHEELVQRNGIYAKMWKRQSGLVLTEEDRAASVDPAWLRELPLLETVDTETLEQIVPWFGTDHCRKDHIIVNEGDPGTKFYILVRGKVEVSKLNADGSSRRLAVLQDGDYFGEMALLNDQPRNATVRAMTPCICLSLQREHFIRLLATNPTLRSHVAATVSSRN